MKKRFLVEFGTGVDLHGGNVTKAAQKALRDAISHCCLTGLSEVAGVKDAVNTLTLEVKIATPFKERLAAPLPQHHGRGRGRRHDGARNARPGPGRGRHHHHCQRLHHRVHQ